MGVNPRKICIGLVTLSFVCLVLVLFYTRTEEPDHLNYGVIEKSQTLAGRHLNLIADNDVINRSWFPPHQHVYYLNTHKTGSSTVYAILSQYVLRHELLPLIPRGNHFNQGGKFQNWQVALVDNVKKYDFVFNHHILDPKIFGYLHNDTFKVTSLREPFKNFVSAFLYCRNRWRIPYLTKIPTDDPVTEFLRHPKKYENRGYGSFTNNRQSMDMGYDLSKGFQNMDYVKQFIQESDRRFDLVLILKYFDEGVVMLKRALRWNTEDILYMTKNVGRYYDKNKNTPALETEQRQLHAKFSQPDILLYDHFLRRFEDQMAKEKGLKEEVAEFRGILVTCRQYCVDLKDSSSSLLVPPGKWNNGFQLTRVKCRMFGLDSTITKKYLINRQRNFLFNIPQTSAAQRNWSNRTMTSASQEVRGRVVRESGYGT